MRPESTALNLTERIDALAAALGKAGVSTEQSAKLLASAASAAMHAVMIDAILNEPAAVERADAAQVAPQPICIAA